MVHRQVVITTNHQGSFAKGGNLAVELPQKAKLVGVRCIKVGNGEGFVVEFSHQNNISPFWVCVGSLTLKDTIFRAIVNHRVRKITVPCKDDSADSPSILPASGVLGRTTPHCNRRVTRP